jgi:hypothetical protein
VSVIDPYSIRAIHGKIENTVKMKQWSEACKTIVVAEDLTQFPSKSSLNWLVLRKIRPQKPVFFDQAAFFTSFGSLGKD